MTTFLLVRHGATDHIGRVLSGWTRGVHLNADGIVQAQAVAVRLASLRLTAVYASPLERARETAALIAEPHRLEPQVEEALGEVRFGTFTGTSFDDLARDEAWLRWNAFRNSARVPGGEMMIEVQARVVAVLQRWSVLHPNALIAVVSHGDVIKAAVTHVLGSPLELMQRLEIAPASVTTLMLDADGARVLGVNALS